MDFDREQPETPPYDQDSERRRLRARDIGRLVGGAVGFGMGGLLDGAESLFSSANPLSPEQLAGHLAILAIVTVIGGAVGGGIASFIHGSSSEHSS